MDTYTVRIQHFEGPFDLLLYFIQRDELDINDIPIAQITKDFLIYIKQLEELNLDVAAEFILVAATLMRIKAKMLIPRKEIDEEGNEIDPRDELVQKLLEYKKYKEVLEQFSNLEKERSLRIQRGNAMAELKLLSEKALVDVELESVNTYKLLQTFKRVLERYKNLKDRYVHEIVKYPYTVLEQQTYIRDRVKNETRITFEDLFSVLDNRMHAIVTFLALLELVNAQEIELTDGLQINSFWIEMKVQKESIVVENNPESAEQLESEEGQIPNNEEDQQNLIDDLDSSNKLSSADELIEEKMIPTEVADSAAIIDEEIDDESIDQIISEKDSDGIINDGEINNVKEIEEKGYRQETQSIVDAEDSNQDEAVIIKSEEFEETSDDEKLMTAYNTTADETEISNLALDIDNSDIGESGFIQASHQNDNAAKDIVEEYVETPQFRAEVNESTSQLEKPTLDELYNNKLTSSSVTTDDKFVERIVSLQKEDMYSEDAIETMHIDKPEENVAVNVDDSNREEPEQTNDHDFHEDISNDKHESED